MERVGGQQEGETQSLRQVIAASFIGTTIEWYDFFLYGSAAALVFGQLFFPYADPLVGTLAAFGIYGVGFAGGAVPASRSPASWRRSAPGDRCWSST